VLRLRIKRTRKAILPLPVMSLWRTAYKSKETILSFPLTHSFLVVLVAVQVAAGMGSRMWQSAKWSLLAPDAYRNDNTNQQLQYSILFTAQFYTSLTLSLLMSYIYGAPSKARNLTSYIYGRNFLLGILLLEPCISLIYTWKPNKYTNYSFSLLIMYGSSYMFRHYIAICRERY
jgi:hypothetical protein